MIYHLKNVSNDYLLLLQYLQEIDNDFEISLSQKVNLEDLSSTYKCNFLGADNKQ